MQFLRRGDSRGPRRPRGFVSGMRPFDGDSGTREEAPVRACSDHSAQTAAQAGVAGQRASATHTTCGRGLRGETRGAETAKRQPAARIEHGSSRTGRGCGRFRFVRPTASWPANGGIRPGDDPRSHRSGAARVPVLVDEVTMADVTVVFFLLPRFRELLRLEVARRGGKAATD